MRGEAIYSLREIEDPNSQIVNVFIELLKDDEELMRIEAALAPAKLGMKSQKVIMYQRK